MKIVGIILGIFILVGISTLIAGGNPDDPGQSMVAALITIFVIGIIIYLTATNKKNLPKK